MVVGQVLYFAFFNDNSDRVYGHDSCGTGEERLQSADGTYEVLDLTSRDCGDAGPLSCAVQGQKSTKPRGFRAG